MLVIKEFKTSKRPNSTTIKPKEETSECLLEKLNALLKQHFHYDSLKPQQFEIIQNVIVNKKDVCAILPTGFGKSICFQLPFLYLNKCVIIVSPLIALMEDQVNQLSKLKIPVCSLSSSNNDRSHDLKKIFGGQSMIIYTTPEYLLKNTILIPRLYEQNMLALIAIDESHCVSNWGHNFRPDYIKLNCIRENAPNIPILALTATATTKIQNDICQNLNLIDPVIIKGNFDRPNLTLYVLPSSSDVFENEIVPLLVKYSNQKVLIYCKTKCDTDKLAMTIQKIGIKCDSYHADKSTTLRNEIQNKFTIGELSCIVATIAFGLGVNLPDIRLVIHFNCPNDLESYYQEIGRAGRDGKPSECYLYYSKRDFQICQYFIKEIKDDNFRKYKESEFQHMRKFVLTSDCRRSVLLKHFDDNCDLEYNKCNNCDNCFKKITNVVDFTNEIYLLLGLINKYPKYYGCTNYIKILRGAKIEKLLKFATLEPNYFGKGNQYSENVWKFIFDKLLNDEYVTEYDVTNGSHAGKVIGISKKGKEWYHNISQCKKDNSDMNHLKIVFDVNDQILKEINISKTNIDNSPTKKIKKINFQDKNFAKNFDELIKEIEFDEKVKTHINKFESQPLEKNNSSNKHDSNTLSKHDSNMSSKRDSNMSSKHDSNTLGKRDSNTFNTTYEFILSGKSISEIAQIRDIREPTIENHIVKLVSEGNKMDLSQFNFTKSIYDEINKKIKDRYGSKVPKMLRFVHEALGKKYSYLQLKLTVHLNEFPNDSVWNN